MNQKERADYYGQAEAFCLMWYECEKCSFREQLWNSRPRVTPFSVLCPKCVDQWMRHVDYNLDEYAPDHIPKKGDRVFTDFSRREAELKYMDLINEKWDDPNYPISENHNTKSEALKSFMNDWQFGQPTIETI